MTVSVESVERGHLDKHGELRECLRIDVVYGPGVVRNAADDSCGAWARCVTLGPGDVGETAVNRLAREESAVQSTVWACDSVPPCETVSWDPAWVPPYP